MKKLLFFLYALICYGIFFAVFLYLIGFVINISRFSFAANWQPIFSKTLDMGSSTLSPVAATAVDLLLIALFGIQHSVMARPGFKKVWTRIVPAPIERSTYVVATSIVLLALYYCWQPVTTPIWDLSGTTAGMVLFIISLSGWGLLLISTFLINHFDLFGLRQPYLYATNRKQEPLTFRNPLFYKVVRHPIYSSFLIAFWFAPLMTLGHLVFAIGMTVYILIGIYHEEKDLLTTYGARYRQYRAAVPRLLPFGKRPSQEEDLQEEA